MIVSRFAGLRMWARGSADAATLRGDVAVISPHLDDAVLSVGAAIAAAGRTGARVVVLSVLAGDPESTAPAGFWDARVGFRTAGDAAAKRRIEDDRACRMLGARCVWLSYNDEQYGRPESDDEIFAAIVDALGPAETVLVPGRPLVHRDHVWLHDLIARRELAGRTVVHYLEQPYAVQHAPMREDDLELLYARLPDRLAKIRAWRAYTSQLRLLGERSLWATARYEARRGGEAVLKAGSP
jgi:LmbE family N-acetylglucosaminyl deacetylase